MGDCLYRNGLLKRSLAHSISTWCFGVLPVHFLGVLQIFHHNMKTNILGWLPPPPKKRKRITIKSKHSCQQATVLTTALSIISVNVGSRVSCDFLHETWHDLVFIFISHPFLAVSCWAALDKFRGSLWTGGRSITDPILQSERAGVHEFFDMSQVVE